MDAKVFVPMQSLLVLAAVIAVSLACGHAAGVGMLVTVGVGALVWVAFAVSYAVRVHGRRDTERREEDRRALAAGVLGLLIPAGIAAGMSASPGFKGLLFSSTAATFTGVALVVIPVAALASSMVDRYLILPYCYGAFGEPVWSLPPRDEEAQKSAFIPRRRYAKIWVAHRVVCEVLCYFSLALIISVLFVAVGNAVSHERTLPVAIESLGGAGIAFTVLAYLRPRAGAGWDYVMAESAGLGTWARGIDEIGETVDGLVVDVSLYPGIKLRTADLEWHYIPLSLAKRLHEFESARPAECDARWCEQAVRVRGEAKARLPRHPS
jgi:hypothetical protein